MIIHDKGHCYSLNWLDGKAGNKADLLIFVKREGEHYPGNVGKHAGTTSQEVMRVLIDRAKYVNQQIPHYANEVIIRNLRQNIYELEVRAAQEHGRRLTLTTEEIHDIEFLPTCAKCGHIKPELHTECIHK